MRAETWKREPKWENANQNAKTKNFIKKKIFVHKVGWECWLDRIIKSMDGLIIVQKTLKIPDPTPNKNGNSMFRLAFSSFGSRFYVSACVFKFQLAFSRFGLHFHVSAHVFTFWLVFSHFASHFQVSPRVFTFRLAFSCFASHFYISAHVFTFRLAFSSFSSHFQVSARVS